MEKKFNRRTFLKRSIATILSISGIGVGSRYYAEYIEPYWIDITNHTISDEYIPNGFSGTTIVQFSDTHLGFQYQLNNLEKTVQLINKIQPDLIVFTGDLMDKPNHYDSPTKIIPILQKLHAPFGKFCIFGNHDHGGYGSDLYKQTMEDSGFMVLQNANTIITNSLKQSIYISGIDDAMLGRPNWENTLNNIPKDAYSILLSHAPDFADRAKNENVSLQLSGHSHGGQVKIPFYGALITPPFAKKYYEGMYNLGNMKLYVNKGLGTTRMPLRFFTRPEITIFTLQAKN
ncbi:metallophosphoesterase [Bacillus massiliigorillae]|uniref:metallophosphoesterase n=1 Tax=Bacillus massiliigorillae TaxID=1243664 RepID=UPI0003AB42DA|nr:metallophosphoesterase [Bacillus massiliigorillae]